MVGAKPGVKARLKPPYPLRSAGLCPSFFKSLRCTRNMDTRVPSLDGYQTCSTVYGDTSMGSVTLAQSSTAPDWMDALYTCCGDKNELKEKYASSASSRPTRGEA